MNQVLADKNLLYCILRWLTPRDLCRSMQVNKLWKTIAGSNNIWSERVQWIIAIYPSLRRHFDKRLFYFAFGELVEYDPRQPRYDNLLLEVCQRQFPWVSRIGPLTHIDSSIGSIYMRSVSRGSTGASVSIVLKSERDNFLAQFHSDLGIN